MIAPNTSCYACDRSDRGRQAQALDLVHAGSAWVALLSYAGTFMTRWEATWLRTRPDAGATATYCTHMIPVMSLSPIAGHI